MPCGTKATSSSDDDDTNADTHADTLASDSSDSLSDRVDEAFIRKLAKKFSKKKQNLKEKKKAPQTALQSKSRSSKTVRAKWTDEMESALVDAVHSTPDCGTDNNLKTQSWNEILRNLQASDHPDLTEKFDDTATDSEALRNKWNLVADYRALKPFRGSEGGSGWSWCEKTHMLIQNDKGIWAEVIEKKLLKPKFQKQGFPHYDKIAEVVDGKYATGNAALYLGLHKLPESGNHFYSEYSHLLRLPTILLTRRSAVELCNLQCRRLERTKALPLRTSKRR
ncbi:hypothetical protein DFJ73DRAFT_29788 [Zopfochytrium polystomum]|nr:hypothetical protein DFJ73DRAFT_29788 [Zopfochytrium polystomum]